MFWLYQRGYEQAAHGYNGLSVNSAKIEAIYKSDASKKSYDEQIYSYVNSVNGKEVDRKEAFLEKLHKGYAEVVKDIVSAKLSKYAAEYAAREIEKELVKRTGRKAEMYGSIGAVVSANIGADIVGIIVRRKNK